MADSIKKSAIDVLRKYRALEAIVTFGIAFMVMACLCVFLAYCRPCMEWNPLGPPNSVKILPNVEMLLLDAFSLLASILLCAVPLPGKNGAGQKIRFVRILEEYVIEKMDRELSGAYGTASRPMATAEDKKRFCALARETREELAALSWFIRVPKGETYIFIVGSRPSGAGQLQPVRLEEALAQMEASLK